VRGVKRAGQAVARRWVGRMSEEKPRGAGGGSIDKIKIRALFPRREVREDAAVGASRGEKKSGPADVRKKKPYKFKKGPPIKGYGLGS